VAAVGTAVVFEAVLSATGGSRAAVATNLADGLVGEEIPLASRIAFVCDAFDAMTTERAYGEALTSAAAIRELEKHAGQQFDPGVVAAFGRALSGRPARTLRLVS
jgi:HD-GYP domain-containing protein (c-di-GMP phosphodiesterase class II)